MDKTLRPLQDFYIGQQVTFLGLIGKVISTNYHPTHPILVSFGSETEAFTKSGQLNGEVVLFGLEESDKADNNTANEGICALLQTTLASKEETLRALREEMPASSLVNILTAPDDEKSYIELAGEVKLLRSLIKGQEGRAKP